MVSGKYTNGWRKGDNGLKLRCLGLKRRVKIRNEKQCIRIINLPPRSQVQSLHMATKFPFKKTFLKYIGRYPGRKQDRVALAR